MYCFLKVEMLKKSENSEFLVFSSKIERKKFRKFRIFGVFLVK